MTENQIAKIVVDAADRIHKHPHVFPLRLRGLAPLRRNSRSLMICLFGTVSA
jgi:hypothetical protein